MNAWDGYIFQYLVGGVVFVLGLWLGTRRRADRVIWARGRWGDRVLIGGFVMYAVVHGLWIVLALRAPVNAPICARANKFAHGTAALLHARRDPRHGSFRARR